MSIFPTPIQDLSEAAGKIADAIRVASENGMQAVLYLSVAIVAASSVTGLFRWLSVKGSQ